MEAAAQPRPAGKRKTSTSDQERKEARKKTKQVDAAAAPAPGSPADAARASDQATAAGKSRLSRKAAANVSYGPSSSPRTKKADRLVADSVPEVDSEQQALDDTQAASGNHKHRRLQQFSVQDENGVPQPLERMDLAASTLQLTGVIYPAEGAITKAAGREVAKPWGPVTGWSLVRVPAGAGQKATAGSKGSKAQGAKQAADQGQAWAVQITTAAGTYVVDKPAAAYKKLWSGLAEQCDLAWEVLAAVVPALGGNAAASLDEVVARLARSGCAKGYGSAREALILNGAFVLQQLEADDARRRGIACPPAAPAAAGAKGKGPAGEDKGKGAASVVLSGAFVQQLQQELAKGPLPVGQLMQEGGALKICEGGRGNGADAAAGAKDAATLADEEMARRLQAKLDAEAAGGGSKAAAQRARAAAANAYLRISETEIADDYPLPKQYEAKEEEADELLLWDEELALVDPEDLPKRLLDNFTIYNAEGFFASLELLPMWSGVDPDMELFASGIVADDQGDWGVGGQPLETPPQEQQQQQAEDAAADDKGKEAAAADNKGNGPAAADDKGKGPTGAAAGSSSKAAGSSSAAAAGGSSSAAAAAGGSSSKAAGSSEDAAAAEPAAAAAAAAGAAEETHLEGMRMYLSQIREWVVEFSADMLLISIRTDAAWYRLVKPAAQYAPWYQVPLKAARIAVKVLGWLAEESRASRLSWGEVVKRLTDQPTSSATFISKKPERVERFLVVHGQILLNQIRLYPKAAVQRAAFVGALKERMALRRHFKLYVSKAKGPTMRAGVNRNPMKDRATARAKPMPATATRMVRSVWQGYFQVAANAEAEAAAAAAAAAAGQAGQPGVATEVEDDLQAEEEEEQQAEETALAGGSKGKSGAGSGKKSRGSSKAAAAAAEADEPAKKAATKKASSKPAAANHKVAWVGASTSTAGNGASAKTLYKAASVGPFSVELGAAVLLPQLEEDEEEEEEEQEQQQVVQPRIGLVQCLWEDAKGAKYVQVRRLLHGCDTVLGDAAADDELFVTDTYAELPLSNLQGRADATQLMRVWDVELRVSQYQEDVARQEANTKRQAAGEPLQYIYRHLYRPDRGMFCALADEPLTPGSYQEPPAEPVECGLLEGSKGVVLQGVEYHIGDAMFVHPATFAEAADSEEDSDEDSPEAKDKAPKVPGYAGRFHKGSTRGLKPYCVVKLLAVKTTEAANSKARGGNKAPRPQKLQVQRFYRPEEVSKEQADSASYWELYAPATSSSSKAKGAKGSSGAAAAVGVEWIDVDDVLGKCAVVKAGEAADADLDTFVVTRSYNPATGELGPPPADYTPAAEPMDTDGPADATAKLEIGGGRSRPVKKGLAMATMDIFAGCGGLSCGMHQAGVADTKWAIEYEAPAADAFKLNYPEATVMCQNCNVVLRAAMAKAGMEADCTACEEAVAQAEQLPADVVEGLPAPGQVEFIMGGPPCQGYSGMNRFNKGNWSIVQNSMVMSFLSYADFYRPRYFLLENVRNFVSHNKSFTFRLTLRTLLDMGYQVRFGVLNAGNYGVPQSRKRTFVWAAAPGEYLPDWPRHLHVFHTPQLTINLPGGVAYTAVPDTGSAPLRAVTVKDAIGDLPPIENGHAEEEIPYAGPPISAYQAAIRSGSQVLRDHICKEMSALNMERCRCIPKNTPGADWRVLQQIVAEDPSREMFQGQPLVPWCLPNTADRHNGWRGLYGRLDSAGHFPTSTTDPNPMGKVGQVFHPEQDRIVSVRECARSQGFPDTHRFTGTVHNRHRQVGNAVPPPLAAALGGQLMKALIAGQERMLATMG